MKKGHLCPPVKLTKWKELCGTQGSRKNGLTATASHLAQATSTAIPLQDWVAKGFFFPAGQ